MGISFGGLATGLDTAALIDAFVGIEDARAGALEGEQAAARQQQAVVKDISDAMEALAAAAEGLDTADEIRVLSATSTSDQVKVTGSSDALQGVYDISVTNLARAETSRSFGFADDAAGVLGGAGTLSITSGASTVDVAYDDTMSLSDVAQAINDSDAEVSASVLFDGTVHRLQVTSRETGLANALSFADSGGLTGLDAVSAEVVTAEDAQFTIAGTTITRSSNVVDDAIAGVTLELLAEGVTDARIDVKADPEAITEKMQTYVDALNAVTSQIQRQLTLVGDEAPEGSLFGDRTLQMLQRDINNITSGFFGPDSARLADFGIQINQQGEFDFDSEAFTAAVAGGTEALEDLFTGDNGLQARLVDLSDRYTDSIDGLLAGKDDALQDLIDRLDDRIVRIDDGASRLRDRLTAQYANLEERIAELNAQGSQLLAFLGI
ncbi:MAG: flagellar filament capping protein FliD [Nannocystaceae bacterium]|nr:flagellar filament capping protein FliD [Nannocystaceae bacterium]